MNKWQDWWDYIQGGGQERRLAALDKLDHAGKVHYFLAQDKYIEDAVNGRLRTRDGGFFPPCSKNEAELNWRVYMAEEVIELLLKNPHWSNRIKHPEKWKGAGKGMLDINPLQGQRELTHDDLIDMWQKAQAMPEPERAKAIRQITQLSKEFESRPAEMLANLLLETT